LTQRIGFPRMAAADNTLPGIKYIGSNMNLEYQCGIGNSVCIFLIKYLNCKRQRIVLIYFNSLSVDVHRGTWGDISKKT
jgi:hypothetical protein